jgi:Flavin containing amine oxidoreductase
LSAYSNATTTHSQFGFHVWSIDPFARSAYSSPRPGGVDPKLAAPLAATAFFAGEATATPPANRTVEGVLASGQRAARELLAGWYRR